MRKTPHVPLSLLALGLAGWAIAAEPLPSASPSPVDHVVCADPDALTFGPAPDALPVGARVAVLTGDPTAEAPYTLRVRMPRGYTVPPHFHPTAESLTVISGGLRVGTGDTVDRAATTLLEPGGFTSMPAGHHHYVIADVDTVLQVHGTGPFVITYVDPADDPRAEPSASIR